MPKYLCIQRSEGGKCPEPSPAQMQEMYQKFQSWMETYEDNIHDMGGKLQGGAVVRADGATDGPYVEAKEIVGGYMIVEADTLEQALEVARESPGVAMPGSSVEVREIHIPG